MQSEQPRRDHTDDHQSARSTFRALTRAAMRARIASTSPSLDHRPSEVEGVQTDHWRRERWLHLASNMQHNLVYALVANNVPGTPRIDQAAVSNLTPQHRQAPHATTSPVRPAVAACCRGTIDGAAELAFTSRLISTRRLDPRCQLTVLASKARSCVQRNHAWRTPPAASSERVTYGPRRDGAEGCECGEWTHALLGCRRCVHCTGSIRRRILHVRRGQQQ